MLDWEHFTKQITSKTGIKCKGYWVYIASGEKILKSSLENMILHTWIHIEKVSVVYNNEELHISLGELLGMGNALTLQKKKKEGKRFFFFF